MSARCGLVLLTGGRGERLGGTKHDRVHPEGGSWGGHLVRVFRAVAPEGPIRVVGAPLPDFPELPGMEDSREGPAVALRAWAASVHPLEQRWWILACDQVDWTAAAFAAWLGEAEAADPHGEAWVVVSRDGHRQPLGGFLGGALIPVVASLPAHSLRGLLAALPAVELAGSAWSGADIDTPEELEAFTQRPARPARP
jgi:molybdopterin-guanine dinucleotide biosynthesis protein A